MGAECSKLRQPIRAILALSHAQLLLIVVTRSRDLSRECHVTKHKTPAKSNFPMSNFKNSETIQFSSSRSTSRGLCPKNFEKRAHPIKTALFSDTYSIPGSLQKQGHALYTRYPIVARARAKVSCIRGHALLLCRRENSMRVLDQATYEKT